MFEKWYKFEHPTGKSRRRRVYEDSGQLAGKGAGELAVAISDAIVFGDMKRQDAVSFVKREGFGGTARILATRAGVKTIGLVIDSAASLRDSVMLNMSGLEPSVPLKQNK